jgi:hypothetical protein
MKQLMNKKEISFHNQDKISVSFRVIRAEFPVFFWLEGKNLSIWFSIKLSPLFWCQSKVSRELINLSLKFETLSCLAIFTQLNRFNQEGKASCKLLLSNSIWKTRREEWENEVQFWSDCRRDKLKKRNNIRQEWQESKQMLLSWILGNVCLSSMCFLRS